MPKSNKTVVAVDPDLYMKRMLEYKEKHSGWLIFRSVYWAIYVFVVGLLFMVESAQFYPLGFTFGSALVILALMLAIYGFAAVLHNKFMKKYG